MVTSMFSSYRASCRQSKVAVVLARTAGQSARWEISAHRIVAPPRSNSTEAASLALKPNRRCLKPTASNVPGARWPKTSAGGYNLLICDLPWPTSGAPYRTMPLDRIKGARLGPDGKAAKAPPAPAVAQAVLLTPTAGARQPDTSRDDI